MEFASLRSTAVVYRKENSNRKPTRLFQVLPVGHRANQPFLITENNTVENVQHLGGAMFPAFGKRERLETMTRARGKAVRKFRGATKPLINPRIKFAIGIL